jgi:hypothetical protein
MVETGQKLVKRLAPGCLKVALMLMAVRCTELRRPGTTRSKRRVDT